MAKGREETDKDKNEEKLRKQEWDKNKIERQKGEIDLHSGDFFLDRPNQLRGEEED